MGPCICLDFRRGSLSYSRHGGTLAVWMGSNRCACTGMPSKLHKSVLHMTQDMDMKLACSVWSRRRHTWMPESSLSSVSCCACRAAPFDVPHLMCPI